VLVPAERRVSPRTGIAVVRSRHAAARTDRRAVPPRTTAENTVLDLVERPHGLPRANRQAVGRVRGRRVFRDLAYESYGLYIELDGRVGHADVDGRFRDLNRDNAAVVEGRVTLRYGWAAVFGTACEAASQVAGLLVARGWGGAATPCGACSG